jgi:hypothetical protein
MYINLGDYCRSKLGITGQSGYYYLIGLAGHPDFGKGLRVKGNMGMYHSIQIHEDDAEIFRQRIEDHRKKMAE